MSFPLIRYVLIAAIRDRLVVSLLIAFAVGLSLSVFLGSAAITEKSGFAIIFSAGLLRAAGVFGLVLFTVFFIRRSFEARDIEFLLSRPVGRAQFLISYSAALSILALLFSLVQAACLSLLLHGAFTHGFVLWALSIAAENIVMVNAALFFSMILSSSALAAMATAGFYVLARMMGNVLGAIDSYEQVSKIMTALEYLMQAISALMPRLDLAAQSSWLIYGAQENTGFVLLHIVIFTFVLIFASIVDLVRRQF